MCRLTAHARVGERLGEVMPHVAVYVPTYIPASAYARAGTSVPDARETVKNRSHDPAIAVT